MRCQPKSTSNFDEIPDKSPAACRPAAKPPASFQAIPFGSGNMHARFFRRLKIAQRIVQQAPNHLTLQSCSEVGAGTARFFRRLKIAQRIVQRAPNCLTLQSCSEAGAGTARFFRRLKIAQRIVQRAPNCLTLQSCSEVGAGTARFFIFLWCLRRFIDIIKYQIGCKGT